MIQFSTCPIGHVGKHLEHLVEPACGELDFVVTIGSSVYGRASVDHNLLMLHGNTK